MNIIFKKLFLSASTLYLCLALAIPSYAQTPPRPVLEEVDFGHLFDLIAKYTQPYLTIFPINVLPTAYPAQDSQFYDENQFFVILTNISTFKPENLQNSQARLVSGNKTATVTLLTDNSAVNPLNSDPGLAKVFMTTLVVKRKDLEDLQKRKNAQLVIEKLDTAQNFQNILNLGEATVYDWMSKTKNNTTIWQPVPVAYQTTVLQKGITPISTVNASIQTMGIRIINRYRGAFSVPTRFLLEDKSGNKYATNWFLVLTEKLFILNFGKLKGTYQLSVETYDIGSNSPYLSVITPLFKKPLNLIERVINLIK